MSNCNSDLVWNIGERQFNENTVGFLKRFEDAICLFSGSVSQLYSNYKIHSVRSAANRLVVLPNQRCHHDTFYNIDHDAVKPTGLYIIPGEAVNDGQGNGLRLVYRSKASKKLKTVPLMEGMERIKKVYEKEGNFLPVIVNKDLRFRKNNNPVMHLHRLDVDSLSGLSKFQVRDISTAIEDKLATLMDHAA